MEIKIIDFTLIAIVISVFLIIAQHIVKIMDWVVLNMLKSIDNCKLNFKSIVKTIVMQILLFSLAIITFSYFMITMILITYSTFIFSAFIRK